MTDQNTMLVAEINQLRIEKNKLQRQVNNLEMQLKNIQGSQLASSLPTVVRRAKSASTSRQPTGRLRTPDSAFITPRHPSGRIVKGNTYSLDMSFDRQKLQQMIQQIDENNIQMEKQREEIRKLKNYIQQLHLRNLDPQTQIPEL